MIQFDDVTIHKAIEEIIGPAEVSRRALAKRRVDIYRDGGRPFLIEQLRREFSEDGIREMRIAPINLLKQIVNGLGAVYKRPPVRSCDDASDQALVDFYVTDLCLNELMQKANRYLVLSSNTVIYTRPYLKKDGSFCLKSQVIPNYLYSVIANPMDKCLFDAVIFSAFVEEGRITPTSDIIPATGVETYSKERGFKTNEDVVASNEKDTALTSSQFLFWSDQEHVTTDAAGERFAETGKGPEQFQNPIGRMPIVNLARDRDNEPWATQGEDMVDLSIAIQLGWSDLLTIAKHQGFGILNIVSEEEPKKLTIGLNRSIWLKAVQNGPSPSIGYVQANSPLAEYEALLDKLIILLLKTNNSEPGNIGGRSHSATSGFQLLLEMSDSIEAIETDKPLMMNVEKDHWELIALWHNWMFDNGLLSDDAATLGKFSDTFGPHIQYPPIRPLESEDEVLARIKIQMDLGLMTREDALKKLNPDATDEQIAEMLLEIDNESQARVAKAQAMFSVGQGQAIGAANATQTGQQQTNVQVQPQDGNPGGQADQASSSGSVLN